MSLDELTCKELVELVTDYLEDALPPAEHLRFENHLMRCEGCRNYLDQMRRTIEIAGKLTEDSLTPQAQQDLLQVFRDWKKPMP